MDNHKLAQELLRTAKQLLQEPKTADIFDKTRGQAEKMYDRARQYKPAKLRVDGTIYVLQFNPKTALFEVHDIKGNDITMELGLGMGLNTRSMATAKKELKKWFM